jgi:molybdate/tungstate transport system substrate-binding protein
MKKLYALIIAAIILLSTAAFSVLSQRRNDTLLLYSADAYVAESAAMLSAFHRATGIAVAPPKGGGSFTLAREIAEGAPADIFLSVSSSALTPQYLGDKSSGWGIAIATDQLVIAYSNLTERNAAASALIDLFANAYAHNSTSMYSEAFSNLTSGAFKIGISNASDDPAGYRAWIALEAAGYLYENNTDYFLKRATANSAVVSADNAAELVAPLEYGQIQFLFIYRSAAVAKGLGYIVLPAQLNQGDPNMSSFYAHFSYEISTGPVYGSTIFIYLTVIANNSMLSASYRFIAFSVRHEALLLNYSLQPLFPAFYFGAEPMPSELLAQGQGLFVYKGPLG